MSLHYFNIHIAAKYGLHEAIVLQSLGYWLAKNVEDKRNFKEGRAWTFNSVKDMQEKYFPYFTEKVLYSTLRKLVKEGIILKGNFNKFGYDKTTWYTLSELGEQLLGIDVHTVPEQELKQAKFANNVESEQQRATLGATTGSKIEHVSKIDGDFREKRENGNDIKEQSKISQGKVEVAATVDGTIPKGGTIPIRETIKNTDREKIIESNVNIQNRPRKEFSAGTLEKKIEEKEVPVREGWIKLTLEELKEQCPIQYDSEIRHRGTKLYGSSFNYTLVSEEQRKVIDELIAADAKLGKIQLLEDMIAFEQQVKADPSILSKEKAEPKEWHSVDDEIQEELERLKGY